MAGAMIGFAVLLVGWFLLEAIPDALFLWCFGGEDPVDRLFPTRETESDLQRRRTAKACLRCGFDLRGLAMLAQCPRCDAAPGFTRSLSQLGLTEAEIREITERKKGVGPSTRASKST
ncbi:MAG TPA: hypothetical protein P5081_09745 [Phycisphaerae bacterium]|mgnify:CR=1 FL=1|nr:hypothetical protein [Phycisphaerae bacterium]HRW53159.1 hypothetical protein [Phycisphaerae bacterium]